MTPEQTVKQEGKIYSEVASSVYKGKSHIDLMPLIEARQRELVPNLPQEGDEDFFFFGMHVKGRGQHYEASCLLKREHVTGDYLAKTFFRLREAIDKRIIEYFCDE